MASPRDTAPSFDKIAAEIEILLIRLGRSAPGAELEIIRDEITGVLDGAGLIWADLAARIAAPPLVAVQRPPAIPPMPPLLPRGLPTTEPADDTATSMSNGKLLEYGYRSPGPGYGYLER